MEIASRAEVVVDDLTKPKTKMDMKFKKVEGEEHQTK
jgi:hypothetical protein